MLDWPAILTPINGGFAPAVRSLSGGQSLSGFEQVQPQMHDRWSAAFSFAIKSREDIFTMRSTLTQLRGRTGTIRVPAFEKGRAPFRATVVNPPFHLRYAKFAGTAYEYGLLEAVTGSAVIVASNQFSFTPASVAPTADMHVTLGGVKRKISLVTGGGPYICTFSPSLSGDTVAPATIVTTLAAAAALNATSLDIAFATGGPPLAGNLFSIGDRLYAVNSAAVLSVGVYRISIWPWLRASALINATVNFTSPGCEMRLSSDDQGASAMRALSNLRFADVNLQFDEVA